MDLQKLKREIDALGRASRKIDYSFKPEEYLSLFDKLVQHLEDVEHKLQQFKREVESSQKDLKSKIKTTEENLSRLAYKTKGIGVRYK